MGGRWTVVVERAIGERIMVVVVVAIVVMMALGLGRYYTWLSGLLWSLISCLFKALQEEG